MAQQDSGIEVLLRRLHALWTADSDGTWMIAEKLEEVPAPGRSTLHQNILKSLMTRCKLEKEVKSTAAGKDSSGADALNADQ